MEQYTFLDKHFEKANDKRAFMQTGEVTTHMNSSDKRNFITTAKSTNPSSSAKSAPPSNTQPHK